MPFSTMMLFPRVLHSLRHLPRLRARSRPGAKAKASALPKAQADYLQLLQHNLSFTKQTKPAQAAVLIAITNEAQPQILFTRRAKTLNNHGGEVSFPGGKRDAGDTSNIAVALREAFEEIALDPFSVTLLGELPLQKAKNGMTVKAIVGLIPANTEFLLSPAEIDRLFFVPLSYFLTHKPTPYVIDFKGSRWQVPAFQVQEEVIWGLTGRLVASFLNQGLGVKLHWPLFLNKRK